jgi:hypothetical protein
VRTRAYALGVLVLLLAGCGDEAGTPAAAGPAPSAATPTPTGLKPTRWPAAQAGGACQLLDYAVVEGIIGVAFDVAAGGRQDATYTCVLQRTGVTVPDLSLAVSPTTASPTIFKNTVAPKGSAAVTGLGKAAYRAGLPAAPKQNRGAGVEIGWLSGNNRIIILRYTMPTDAPPEATAQANAKLVELAAVVDKANVR